MYTFSEQCDGNDLDGETCATFGYGSGALACSGTCSFDTTGCRTCVAGSPLIAGCNVLPSAAYDSFSMAASDTETAIIWIYEPSGAVPEAGLAILSSNLDVIFNGHIPNVATKPYTTISSKTMQIAALPSGGWVALANIDDSLTLYAVDGAGNVVTTSALYSTPTASYGIGSATLVQQPNGGPLVIWDVENGIDSAIYDAVVSADGRSVTTPIQVPANPGGSGGFVVLASAVFAAGEFQALVSGCTIDAPCSQIVSIGTDGSIAGSFQVPDVVPYLGAFLISGGDDVRLLYGGDCGPTTGNHCLWAERFSSAGVVLSPAVPVDGPGPFLLPDSAVALGADSYLAFSGSKSSILVHLSSTDAIAGDALIATGSSLETTLVQQGAGLVAGLFDSDRIRIEVEWLTP